VFGWQPSLLIKVGQHAASVSGQLGDGLDHQPEGDAGPGRTRALVFQTVACELVLGLVALATWRLFLVFALTESVLGAVGVVRLLAVPVVLVVVVLVQFPVILAGWVNIPRGSTSTATLADRGLAHARVIQQTTNDVSLAGPGTSLAPPRRSGRPARVGGGCSKVGVLNEGLGVHV